MKILLFDVDGTLCESGKKISTEMANILVELSTHYNIGIVGGGMYEKILYQLDGKIKPLYIFSECGSVYHKFNIQEYIMIQKNNLRTEKEYIKINLLVKTCLRFISETTNYVISGNFIDLRNGLIYVSLVGMSATDEERQEFIKIDNIQHYRYRLIEILKKQAIELELDEYIEISLGGSVGIAINPKKWNKTQVLNYLNISNNQIHFFGDKYLPDGNDYALLTTEGIIPHCVDSLEDTFNILQELKNNF